MEGPNIPQQIPFPAILCRSILSIEIIISTQGAMDMRNLAAKCVIGISAGCGMSVLASTAHATVIASEPFNYSAGPIAGDNGGTGWAGAWTLLGGSVTTGGPSTMLPVPSGTAAVTSEFMTVASPSGTGFAQRFFGSTITSASLSGLGSNTLYFSYLTQRNDTLTNVDDLVIAGSVNGVSGNVAGIGVDSTAGTTTVSNWGILNQKTAPNLVPRQGISSITSPRSISRWLHKLLERESSSLWVTNPQGTSHGRQRADLILRRRP